MILDIGKSGKCYFYRFFVKTNIFEYGDHGVVIEREKGQIYIYVTDNRCSKIYATVCLGKDKFLKKNKVMCINYNDHVFLVDAGFCCVLIDYEAEKVTVNNDSIVCRGSQYWGADVKEPWQDAYNGMFGLD